jgi:uncharacterized protein YfbU (UPF0304 family)
MTLTKLQRLILINQFRILEKLYPDEADHYKNLRIALEKGYSSHYDDLVQWIDDDLPDDECHEVFEILRMYRYINFSYKNLEDKSNIDASNIKFPGFDGNNEGKQLCYAKYLMHDLDNFKELHDSGDYPDYNSHTRMLDKYRRMLAEWNSSQNKLQLTAEEIRNILNA